MAFHRPGLRMADGLNDSHGCVRDLSASPRPLSENLWSWAKTGCVHHAKCSQSGVILEGFALPLRCRSRSRRLGKYGSLHCGLFVRTLEICVSGEGAVVRGRKSCNIEWGGFSRSSVTNSKPRLLEQVQMHLARLLLHLTH